MRLSVTLLALFLVASPLTASAALEARPIPTGATSLVALPASNVQTCTPPNYYDPLPTEWSVVPSGVKIDARPPKYDVPVAGWLLSVTVPSSIQPGTRIFISWTGLSRCATFNGHVYVPVGSRRPPLTRAQVKSIVTQTLRNARRHLERLKGYTEAGRRRRAADAERERDKWRKTADAYARAFENVQWAKAVRDRLDPKNWPKTNQEAGVSLRVEQLKAMPEFVSDINKIASYDTVVVSATETYYATEEGRTNIDVVTFAYFANKSYQSMTPEEKAEVGRYVQRESGALKVLIQDARQAGKSATKVTFGG